MEGSFLGVKKKNPYKKASFLSRWTFWWTFSIFNIGLKRDLFESDLTEPLPAHRSSNLGRQYAKAWEHEVYLSYLKKRKPKLHRVIGNVTWSEMLKYAILLFIIEVPLRLHQPYFLALMLRYFVDTRRNETEIPKSPTYVMRIYHYNDKNQSAVLLEEAIFFAVFVCLISFIYVFVQHPYQMGVMHIGMKIRIGISSLIYRKSLKLTKGTLTKVTPGQIMNLVSNDVLRFDNAPMYCHYLWISPIQAIIITVLLYYEIGVAAIYGAIAVFIFIPLQIVLGILTIRIRRNTAIATDERVRQMNEIIQGMQVIKMYTWEYPFIQLIFNTRKREIKYIQKSGYIKGITMSFIMFTARAGIFISIFVYILWGNHITAEQMFMITSHYLILRHTMTTNFPQAVTQCAEAIVAIKRIQEFMHTEEAQGSADEKLTQTKRSLVTFSTPNLRTLGFQLSHVNARWAKRGPLDLNDVSLLVEPGRLVAIIGPVGSGKSTLLSVVLRELPVLEGRLTVNGTISYSSQEPWLFAGSIRQNILFGSPYDRDRYMKVISVCALVRDFKQLSYGDRTIVGEKGVSLSGGQRARVNLARCVYKEADIYILDDPLSAVDTAVGRQIFSECISKYLKEKTVILVTHQLQYLRHVDHIVIMDKGKIEAEGTFNELSYKGLQFSKMLRAVEEGAEQDKKMKDNAGVQMLRSISMVSGSGTVKDGQKTEAPKEMRTYGAVKCETFTSYFKQGGNCILLTLMIMGFLGAQVCASGGDYWIANWVIVEVLRHPPPYMEPEEPSNSVFRIERDTFIYIYIGILCSAVVVTLSRSFIFFTICKRSSTKMHDTMFRNVAHATMRFFNTNPSGIILNRFSKDIGQVDELLPAAFIDFVQITLTLVGACVVIMFVNYWLIIPTTVMCIGFYYIRSYYVRTSRSLKRLEGITKSPVFNHLNASLQGLATIRAFSAEKILISEFDGEQDIHSSAWFLFIGTSRAFGYWLDLICTVYITIVTFTFLFDTESDKVGGLTGLAITQVMGLIGMFQWGMRQSAELENQLTSVERIFEYNNIEQERNYYSPKERGPPVEWPVNPSIEFKKFSMQYSIKSPPVLRNLELHVQPKEKIGIVGRTGAGKSSLIYALFRLTDVIDGRIIIDEINTKYIGLHELRRKLSIIPQEPVLFSGTIRYNLDPFDEYPDYKLYQALEVVELSAIVSEELGGLNSAIAEDGANFSVGERQLVCLARALVRNNKILILDEATANIDPQTDNLIQTTIREKFADCTVLTIAHRLNTIMDSDRVLVIDAGKIVEVNHSYLLLQDKDGFLTRMVSQLDRGMQQLLYEVAEQSYNKKFGTPKINSDDD